LPLRLGEFSEPLPDIAVVRARSDHYLAGHPSADEVWLVIEVSDSTLAYDREVKAALYANHGVTELWVIDLAQLQLLRYRKPADGRYTSAETLPMSRVPVAGTGIEIDLGTLAIAQTS
jgi:Uma2 family endonuclease